MHLPDLINEIQAQQGTIIKVWNITYYKTRPCKLILATWHAKEIQYPDYTGLDDKETPYLAIQYSTKTTDLIFDPCTGLGTTLKAAQHHNRNFLGIELNSHRASTLTDKTLQTETQRDGP